MSGYFRLFPLLLLCAAGAVFGADKRETPKIEALLPSHIPPDRPAIGVLTAELRGRVKSLGLNDIEGLQGEKISRALLLLPADRAKPGVINFEIESGSGPGVYQCEALGRGATSLEPETGWIENMIGATTIYYAPAEAENGATVPGIYDLRNITPDRYEIVFLGKPEDLKGETAVLAAAANPDGKPKPFFSAVWKTWYSKAARAVPVDMTWAEDSQRGTQGEGRPVFERRSAAASPEEQARRAAQLAHSPRYYIGPYGRSGWAVHTDRWEDEERRTDPKFSGRPELSDFRFRDTSGCVKLRPGCLAVLNEFISEQETLGRRVQLEVRETPLLNAVPVK